jgi:hypothetical protein
MKQFVSFCVLFIAFPAIAGAQSPPPATPKSGAATQSQPTPGAGPVIVVETVKGTFAFETYPDDAPKTVEHVVRLVKRGFYNGQRIHRAVPGFLIQFGDPQTSGQRHAGRRAVLRRARGGSPLEWQVRGVRSRHRRARRARAPAGRRCHQEGLCATDARAVTTMDLSSG